MKGPHRGVAIGFPSFRDGRGRAQALGIKCSQALDERVDDIGVGCAAYQAWVDGARFSSVSAIEDLLPVRNLGLLLPPPAAGEK